MTTQKITSTLKAAGFNALYKEYEIVNGKRVTLRKGDYNAFKAGKIIGVETYGIKTAEMIAALVAKGINAVEAKQGNGMIKIS